MFENLENKRFELLAKPMSLRSLALWAAAGRISLIGWQADAATFVKADVTTLLGPTFFVDDAVEAAVTAVAAPANASG